jgi:hypothetical protein
MKKAFPIALVLIGLVFVGAGVYTLFRGFDARNQVSEELAAQNIVTPEDASIPNAVVDDADTATAMADIINVHAMESTGGLTYAEMGRFVSAENPDDPAGTSNPDEALIGDNGQPVPNSARNTALTAANLRTSLYTSVLAFNVTDLVVGVGAMIVVLGLAVGGLGVALAGMVIPSLARKLHVSPVPTA